MPALRPEDVLAMDALLCLEVMGAKADAGTRRRGDAGDEVRADGSIVRSIGGMDDLRSFLRR